MERAETYLRSVVAGSAPVDRSIGYLRNVTATVEMLRRTTPIRLSWARDYSDYHPEKPGGSAGGRTCECRPLNSAILGEHLTRLRPGVMEVKIPMPTTTADYRWMNLMTRVPRKGLPTIAKRLAQGWADYCSADVTSRADRLWPPACSPVSSARASRCGPTPSCSS